MEPRNEMQHGDAFFRSLIENASDLVAIVDGEGALLYASPAAERILGHPAGALVGKSVFGLLHEHDVASLRGAMAEAIAITPHPRTLLCRLRHQDGSWRTIESIVKGFRQDGGAPVVILNARDITARKRAEDRLAIQLGLSSTLAAAKTLDETAIDLLRLLVDHLGWDVGCLWLVDDGTRALRCVASWTRPPLDAEPSLATSWVETSTPSSGLVGRVLEGASPAWIEDLTSPIDGPSAQPSPLSPIRGAAAFPVIAGREVAAVVELLSYGARRPDDDLLGILTYFGAQVGQFIDRKRAEDALCQKRAELEAILRALPDLFFRLDGETRFLDYAGALSALSVPPAEFLGRQVREVLPPHVANVVEQAIAETHRTRTLATAEFELDVMNSPQQFEGRFVSFLEGQTIALCRNVTDRRRAEDALRESEDRLRESQKMEAVGRLAGGIAHDFNNLLMAILGYSNMLIGRLGEDHPLTHDLDEIRRAGERAAALTKQLLAFSRRQVVKPLVLDLGAIVTEMETMLGRVIGEHIAVETNLAADLGRVRADRSQIEQVLMNLALNARDAMPNGGRLAIRLENVRGGGGDADAGPLVALTVTDTGCGMDAETQSHMFEPFFTTKRHGRGTGLGLSTVYGIVQQSGGVIRVESAPGRGSTFVLSFPSVDDPVDVVPPVSSTGMPRGRETILVVEDEDAVRSLVVEVLLRLGYRVMEAGNAADAFERLRHHHGKVQLLVTDVVMPGASGRELAGKLVVLYPACRVLYMSGYAESALLDGGAPGPERDLLQKPFTPEALANRVRDVLDRASTTP